MQRGFFQIPVLIMVLIGIVAVGGTGYVAYEVGKTSQNGSPKVGTAELQATTTENITATTTVEVEQKDTTNKDSMIGSLQKKVSDLTKKVSLPKPEEPKGIPTSETSKDGDSSNVSVPTNPSARCLAVKKDWDAFIASRSSYESKFNSLTSSYKSYSTGTSNSPSDPIPYFTYVYNRMTAGKTSFTSTAESVRKAIDTISRPPTATDEDFQNIKDSYDTAISDLQISFDLKYQSAAVIGNDKDGVGNNDLDSAMSLYNDSQDAYKKALADIANVSNIIVKLQKNLNGVQSNNCIYYFSSGENVWTTTQEERAFSQSQPSVTSAYQNFSEATVSISTSLPIDITEDGNTKTVLRLNCFYNYYPPVQRTSPNTVSALVKKSSMKGNKCVFLYSGNGDDISSGTAYLPW